MGCSPQRGPKSCSKMLPSGNQAWQWNIIMFNPKQHTSNYDMGNVPLPGKNLPESSYKEAPTRRGIGFRLRHSNIAAGLFWEEDNSKCAVEHQFLTESYWFYPIPLCSHHIPMYSHKWLILHYDTMFVGWIPIFAPKTLDQPPTFLPQRSSRLWKLLALHLSHRS